MPKEAGFAAMIAGIMVACLWPFIFPDSANALFPSLAFNLLFLVPGVLWSLYKIKIGEFDIQHHFAAIGR